MYMGKKKFRKFHVKHAFVRMNIQGTIKMY